ncbi:MAG TPA: CCA tRNA nucleotidyltransferase [Candidatus Bathyarchaeia archaeon]|nr:CCA tRNA nucleotidyltransferase [Candidatus Bathyarchaeia archaeon]
MTERARQSKIKQVCSEVLEKISPTEQDRKRIWALANELERKVAASASKKGIPAVVRVEGSVAKDTWLKEEPDIDVFMCLPPTIPRKTLGTVSLEIAREATEGSRQVERFAEHPYLEAFVDDFRVNIVPCYCAERGEWLSATDRTPFHTDYVNKHLNLSLRGEVRLLKRFLQGIRVYGAEIKVGGFSGYLCEILIIHYGSFVETLESFAKCTPKMVVDIENYYAEREKELRLLFNEPLVIVDPVDKGRNVASAVKPQKIYTLVAAAREFLKAPRKQFFFPPKTKALSGEKMKRHLEHRGSDCLFLTFNAVNAVPDVLWGQLYRTQRALRKLLELHDFRVLRDTAWSDEKALTAFVFELEQRVLAGAKKHLGPPLERENECENFLSKYADNNSVVSGPYIEDGRWLVEIQRKHTDAVELLTEKLKDGGRNAGVAELISEALKEEFNIKVNGEVLNVYSCNSAFAEFLTDFLSGKPFWLKPNEA